MKAAFGTVVSEAALFWKKPAVNSNFWTVARLNLSLTVREVSLKIKNHRACGKPPAALYIKNQKCKDESGPELSQRLRNGIAGRSF